MATHDALTDEQLAERVQQGCSESFAELDRRFRPRLVRLLNFRLKSRVDAEDVTQQTLLRVFQKIEHYNVRQAFRPWVHTIALRLATDYLRRQRKHANHLEASSLCVPDAAPRVEQQMLDRETRQGLWQLVARVLPSNQCTALWLFYGEGQSIKEIAQTMKKTGVSVRVLLYRARRALLPHLESNEINKEAVASIPEASLDIRAEVHP